MNCILQYSIKLDLDHSSLILIFQRGVEQQNLIPRFYIRVQLFRMTKSSLKQNEQVNIRKYPIRFTPQHIGVNLVCKIIISKLMQNIEDFLTSF